MKDLNIVSFENYDGLSASAINKLNKNFKRIFEALSGEIFVSAAGTERIQLDGVEQTVVDVLNRRFNEWFSPAYQQSISKSISSFFPVGFVFITDTNINPTSYLPGSWKQIDSGEYVRIQDSNSKTGGCSYTINKASSGESLDVITPSSLDDPYPKYRRFYFWKRIS
ncbi:MAG: hypothetical protein HUJ68_10625 [Clostridia bacterium]|nr:hypothetical protein [Clostridia bacterium]